MNNDVLIEMINRRFDDFQNHFNTQIADIKEDIRELKMSNDNHSTNCVFKNTIENSSKKINKIDDELLDYRAFKKYKKIFISGIAGMLIVTMLQLIYVYRRVQPVINEAIKVEKLDDE